MTTDGSLISRMLNWWAVGLRQALPERLSNLIFGPSAVLSLTIEDDEVEIALETPRRVHVIAKGEIKVDPKTGTRKLARSREVRNAATIDAGELVVRLPGAQILSTQIDLPAEAALDLKTAIRNDLDRFTPFSSDSVYFDARILGVDGDNHRVKVALQVAQIADVESALSLAKSAGFKPTRATGAPDPDMPDLNVLPPRMRFRPWRVLPKLVKTLALALVCVLGLQAAVLFNQKTQALDRSQQQIRQLRTTAIAASEMEDRLADYQRSLTWLEDAKSSQVSALTALATITQSLVDNSFIISFALDEDTATLTGFSLDPSAMLVGLEDNDRLKNARFTAPVTRDERTGLNRFIVDVEIVGEAG